MTPQPPRPGTGLSLLGLLEVGAILAVLATVTGFFGRGWWIFELTTHFRLHFGLLLGAMAVVLGIRRRWAMMAICAGGASVNAGLVCWLLWPAPVPPPAGGAPLRLVTLNVHSENERSDLVLEFLRRVDADVILLMEINARWMAALKPLQTQYPQTIAEPREDNFGIALFSRCPLTNSEVFESGPAEVPSIAATVEVGGAKVFLLGTHPLPPGSAARARSRNEQLRELALRVRRSALPTILLGDLNCTPGSPYFAELLAESRLKNTSQGRGLFGSWPAWLPAVRIPLDHCLVSPAIQVRDKLLGADVGSDHLPVVVAVQIPISDPTLKTP